MLIYYYILCSDFSTFGRATLKKNWETLHHSFLEKSDHLSMSMLIPVTGNSLQLILTPTSPFIESKLLMPCHAPLCHLCLFALLALRRPAQLAEPPRQFLSEFELLLLFLCSDPLTWHFLYNVRICTARARARLSHRAHNALQGG